MSTPSPAPTLDTDADSWAVLEFTHKVNIHVVEGREQELVFVRMLLPDGDAWNCESLSCALLLLRKGLTLEAVRQSACATASACTRRLSRITTLRAMARCARSAASEFKRESTARLVCPRSVMDSSLAGESRVYLPLDHC